MSHDFNRRRFLTAATAAGVGLSLGRKASADVAKPAAPPVRKPSSSWPRLTGDEDQPILDVLHGCKWYRGAGEQVNRFEEAYAKLCGAKHCIATANGTGALICSLGALGVGPGDEVIVPPYTFIATVDAVLMHHALPVFVDTDPETFQIDHRKIESAITERTVAILPVHIGGSPAHLDAILEIGRRRNLPVVEDACQSILGEWRGRKLGTWGAAGCFSFQMSENLTSGEGGAIFTNDDDLAQRCFAFHNNCRGRPLPNYKSGFLGHRAGNFRMTEFQATLLQLQMPRLDEQSILRNENANYLSGMLSQIPGLAPAKLNEGCTRGGFHLYMFRYHAEQFNKLPRVKFLRALHAAGVPGSAGYSPLNKEPFLQAAINSRGFQRCFPKEVLARWSEATRCPQNDKLCEEGVWFGQTTLLGARSDMERIVEAIAKVHKQSGDLASK